MSRRKAIRTALKPARHTLPPMTDTYKKMYTPAVTRLERCTITIDYIKNFDKANNLTKGNKYEMFGMEIVI